MMKATNILLLLLTICIIPISATDKNRKISRFPLDNYRALLNYSQVRDTLYTLSDTYIDVNLNAQAAYLHKKNGDIQYFKISSGNPKLPKGIETKDGLYVIQSKMPKWYSRQFDSTLMLNWMGFNFGIGFHALAGNSYYRYLGKKASSHGCVRVSREDALSVYEQIKLGTPVLVHSGSPAIAIQFADTNSKYSFLNTKNLEVKHNQRLKDLYEGKYLLYYDEKFLIDVQNIPHKGLEIGSALNIPSRPVYYPYFIDIALAQEDVLNKERKKVFRMVETEKVPFSLLTFEK